MPTPIYPKAINNISAVTSNGFLTFSFDVTENYDANTSTGDNTNSYAYNFPQSLCNLTLINGNGQPIYFELASQNQSVAFNAGEYYDISNGVLLDISQVYGVVIGALSI